MVGMLLSVCQDENRSAPHQTQLFDTFIGVI
jgi:hypothetical protein